MSSTIISFPNVNKFINFKGKYILPKIDNDKYSYFILTNTKDKYLLTNNDINNRNINIEIFAVGGGGAGGYYNGNGGDGGTVIYKKLEIKKDTLLTLEVGSGGYYVTDNNYIRGFKFILYEGLINDIFNEKNNYIMNMNDDDIILKGLIKKIEQKITNLNYLTDIDINSTIINNPILKNQCLENPLSEDCLNNNNNFININRSYTININSYFFVPYDCSIEIIIESPKYAIIFFYNDDDIKNNLFKSDLIYYNKNPTYNSYWLNVENNNKKTFKRENLKQNEKYYFKLIGSQDTKIEIKLITKNKQEYIINDNYFKYNNSNENFGLNYSTATVVSENNEKIINAIGGISGSINSINRNYGKGGCISYDLNNKKIKICNDDINGYTGIKLPNSISSELKDLNYKLYRYGSSGGGANWKSNDNGGKGGIDAGNGVSFTNIPSLSSSTPNTGGGGGGNSFLSNITERKMKISKLRGADGIIIIKVIKKIEQTLIQTFVNMDNKNEILNINQKLESIYESDNVNIYDKEKFLNNLNINRLDLNNFGLNTAKLFIFFSILMNNIKGYVELTEKEKLRYPIKFIYDEKNKRIFFLENNYYNFNFANYNEINYYFSIIRPNLEVKEELLKIFINNELIYNNQLNDESYFNKILNDILDPSKLILFIENVNKHYFNNFNYFMNYVFFTNIYNLIIASNNNNDIIINKVNELSQIIKNFNINYFTPIDKNSDDKTDTLIKDRTYYVEQQLEYKKIYEKNLEENDKSNKATNYSINVFKAKYYQNKKNNWFNILFYISIFLVIISFIITYNLFENDTKPLVILVLFIIMLIIIILLWNYSNNELKIFEKFGCNDNNTSANCIDYKGNIITNNSIIPYYYISKGISFINIKPKNDIIADIFVYSSPFYVKIDGIDRYYEPNIDIYKNILLPKTFTYKIYNNKIIISSPDNNDIILLKERERINETSFNELRLYECNGEGKDICNITYKPYKLSNKYTRYNNKGEILEEINKQPIIEDISIRNYFDFIPDNSNNNYIYSIPYISEKVIKEPYIVIKIINDLGASTETLEETIHNFRKEMSVFKLNVNLYLLNKNTKKIVDFTSKYELDSQKEFSNNLQYNNYIYDRNVQAYNIISREIIINFYIKFLICIIIIIILFCIFLYHYNNNQFPKILLLGLLLTGIAIYLILYNIFKHTRLDAYKYYFKKPENIYINKLNNNNNNEYRFE
jgi:hypothetical protein